MSALAAFASRKHDIGKMIQCRSAVSKAFEKSLVDIDGVGIEDIIIAGIYLRPGMNISKAEEDDRNVRMFAAYP